MPLLRGCLQVNFLARNYSLSADSSVASGFISEVGVLLSVDSSVASGFISEVGVSLIHRLHRVLFRSRCVAIS